MAYNVKKVKGYLVSVLVFYTILVTYFLAQTAWNDDVTVRKRHRRDDGGLLSVLYQEERRHLRSFKDVVKTYGGSIQSNNGGKSKRESQGGIKSGDGRIDGRHQVRDFYGEDGSNTNITDKGVGNDSDVIQADAGLRQAQVGRMSDSGAAVDVESRSVGVDGESIASSSFSSSSSQHNPNTGNIFIEEDIPTSSIGNASSYSIDKSKVPVFNINSKDNKLTVRQNSFGAKGSSKSSSSSTSGNNNIGSMTEYCDKIDAMESHLCLSEQVSFGHPRHVNITTNHLSFKPLGDLYIYSAFLDTRRKPSAIRLMIAGPKGRDAVLKSGYWCAFSLPATLTQRHYWNGRREPVSSGFKSDQATPLGYYAASAGHDRKLQFYVMSCAVPARHLPTLVGIDTSRIYLVAGGRDTPLLDTVQERISVDVINNLGLPWQQVFDKSLLEKTSVNLTAKTNLGENARTEMSPNSTATKLNMADASDQSNPNLTVKEMPGKNQSSAHLGRETGQPQPTPRPSPSPHPNSIVSCVAPVFASVSVLQMVEFLELTLLLGSQHIIIYVNHVNDDVSDVLSQYRYRGLVTTLPWTIPDPLSIWARGRDIALTDCLYRAMYRYEFALFHDMDEFFVPRVTPDLPSFINFLQSKGGLKTSKISDLVFTSAYFSPPSKLHVKSIQSLQGYTKDVIKFASLRSIHRTYFNAQHTLRMTRPVTAFRVGAGERKKTVFNISPRYAAINHYSKCVDEQAGDSGQHMSSPANKTNIAAMPPGNSGGSANLKKDTKQQTVILCSNTKVDMHMWRLKDRLIRQSRESIRDLNSRSRG